MFRCPWLRVRLDSVTDFQGSNLDYYSVKIQRGAMAAVIDRRDRLLMIRRSRFITQEEGWEIPGGIVEDDEEPIIAAAREAQEETGWRPKSLAHLISFQPMPSRIDCVHDIFLGTDPKYHGPPSSPEESSEVEWVPLKELRQMIRDDKLIGAGTLIAALRIAGDQSYSL